MESIGFYENYELFYDNIYQYLYILQKSVIINLCSKMNTSLEKINNFYQIKKYLEELSIVIENLNIYKKEIYIFFKNNLTNLFYQVKNNNYSGIGLYNLEIIEKNINNIFANINELSRINIPSLNIFDISDIENSEEMIRNTNIAFLLIVDFNYLENSKSIVSIIKEIANHPPFFVNYIGFFRNNIFNQENNYHKEQKKYISLSLKYEKDIKEDLKEIFELLFNMKNSSETRFAILMNNKKELHEEDIKFSDCIFIKQNEDKYLTHEKMPIKKLHMYYRDLFNFINKKYSVE